MSKAKTASTAGRRAQDKTARLSGAGQAAKVAGPATAAVAKPAAEDKPRDAARTVTDTAGVRVKATKLGFYDNKRMRIGNVFTIAGTKHPKGHPREGQLVEFSRKWMRIVSPDTPEQITPGFKALKALNEEQLATRRAGGGSPVVGGVGDTDDVIGDDEVGD